MRRKVIMTKGLPASGKSTFAKNLIKRGRGRWKRVNKDLLRRMVDAGEWNPENERLIEAIRDTLVLFLVRSGFNVVIDDTNLDPKHIERIKIVVAGLASVEVVDFPVSVEECIVRDSYRDGSKRVGQDVILRLARQWMPDAVPERLK